MFPMKDGIKTLSLQKQLVNSILPIAVVDFCYLVTNVNVEEWLCSSTLASRWQSSQAMLSFTVLQLCHTEIKRWTNRQMSVCFN